ncbi:MAG: prenyltransferase [Chloroflexota bacterium]|nr:prenyltransferase [Chloroflexota bacterium]
MDLRTGVSMFEPAEGLRRLATFPFALLSYVGEDGYPVSVAVDAAVVEGGTATFAPPAGLAVPLDREIGLTGSHIRPRPGYGYDERRHVTVWGRAEANHAGRLVVRPVAAWGWDEATIPFPEYVERQVGQSRRYLARLSAELGRPVRPRLSLGWLTLRATRLPFLSATFIPVLIGLAIAAWHGFFDLPSALLTIVGAAAVHLGLNVANDVFDARLGADEKNVNPTQYSGGSRVIQYGLVSLRDMALISAAMYAIAIGVGLVLLMTRYSPALLAIGVTGIIISLFYTAPPLKLVYRGVGEVMVGLGFGPIMLLGAYVVQSGGSIPLEPIVASVPIGILVALILYVNEVPDRPADERAGKRTLPVLLPRAAVVNVYLVAALVAFAVIGGGVLAGVLPLPALIALLGLPLVRRVYDGLQQYYESPYGLMAVMAVNIRLHLVVGGLLLLAYVVVIAIAGFAPGVPLFLPQLLR